MGRVALMGQDIISYKVVRKPDKKDESTATRDRDNIIFDLKFISAWEELYIFFEASAQPRVQWTPDKRLLVSKE